MAAVLELRSPIIRHADAGGVYMPRDVFDEHKVPCRYIMHDRSICKDCAGRRKHLQRLHTGTQLNHCQIGAKFIPNPALKHCISGTSRDLFVPCLAHRYFDLVAPTLDCAQFNAGPPYIQQFRVCDIVESDKNGKTGSTTTATKDGRR